MFRSVTLMLTVCLIIFSQTSRAESNYNLSNSDIKMIQLGHRLYLQGKYSGQYGDGRYTDPNPMTVVYDFWSNGIFARYDRDHDGRHETVLQIEEKRIVYVGILGKDEVFVHVGKEHQNYLHRPLIEYVLTLFK